MSDLTDRILKQAEQHDAQLKGKQKAEEDATTKAKERQRILEEGTQGVWDSFAAKFIEVANELKSIYPNERISVLEGGRELGIEKAKDPSVRINYTRTSNKRISMMGTLGVPGGFPLTIHRELIITLDDFDRLCLQDAQRPNLTTTADAVIEEAMGIVIKTCGTK